MTCLGGAQTLNLTLCDERMQNLSFSLTYLALDSLRVKITA